MALYSDVIRLAAHAEGFAEGKKQGERDLLLGLIEQRFGPIPDETIDFICNAELEELDRWVKRFCRARTVDQLLG